jgi:AraC-like DNA-binding protein
VSQRSQHGFLNQILCGSEIARHLHQRRRQLARVFTYHTGQLGMHRISHMDS